MQSGQTYYYVENNKIKCTVFTGCKEDVLRLRMNNCYESKSDCLNKLKNLDE